jgi:hypothetical protein
MLAGFDVFFGVIPSATRIGHKDGHAEAAGQTADQQAQHTPDAQQPTHNYGS